MVKCRNDHTRILEGSDVNLASFKRTFSAKSILTALEKFQYIPRVLLWATRVEDKPWLVLDFPVPVARIDGHLGNDSQSDIASLESPSADGYGRHRRLRSARCDTAVSRSILEYVGCGQRETGIRGECIDNHAGDDSDGTDDADSGCLNGANGKTRRSSASGSSNRD